MLLIYNIGILIYGLLLKIVSPFIPKAKLFTEGRKHLFEKIAQSVPANERPIWFHFPSLGEFEQGRTVLEKIKSIHPQKQIVITFFSPSGYEVRKDYALAKVFYLPLDTSANATKFVELINPSMAIFTKYDFWYHYFNALHKQQIPLYLISGIFRPNQLFFKWYGGFYRKTLSFVTHFFVQNKESAVLLNSIGIDEVSISGDTRFDRVYENTIALKKIVEVETFCGDAPVFMAGSTWLADERLLVSFAKKYPDWKLIIAPHEVDENRIADIEKLFPNSIRFSQLKSLHTPCSLLIIDNIGMLSALYQYAKVAYIGGGFGAGIHNTLEAAAFGLPVIFGPKYDKFQEAKDLIAIEAAKSISTNDELLNAFEYFKINEKASAVAKNYVQEKKGATDLILEKLNLNKFTGH